LAATAATSGSAVGRICAVEQRIEPDTKDWTWVLSTPCPECGFVAADVDVARVGDEIRANAALWPVLLGGARASRRPRPDTWWVTEFACHVRADPVEVAPALLAVADAVASRYDGVRADQRGRTGFRSDGSAFTVDSLARYHLHDVVHHVWDVRHQPTADAGTPSAPPTRRLP
jgi:hypothetical protein